jgi:DNA-binding LytR/AlgR family response regulator
VKIALCDDDSFELENIKNTVSEFIASRQSDYQITVNTFTNGNDLLCYINKYGGFDLLILDIVMPGMNGIELAAEIRNNNTNCKIIFLTSSSEFAVNSYKVNAFYYLLKPFSGIELISLLNAALNQIGEEKSNSIAVKEKGKLTRVQINAIQYVESIIHKITFHLRGNEVISCYGTMNEFQAILSSDKRFTKCHKSFIVNMDYIINERKFFIPCHNR